MLEYQERNEVKMPGHNKNGKKNLSSIIWCQQPIRAAGSGGIQNFSRNPEGFFHVCVCVWKSERERDRQTDACSSQSGRKPAGASTPGPMRALPERTLPFLDNTSSPASTNKMSALSLVMLHSPTAEAWKHLWLYLQTHLRLTCTGRSEKISFKKERLFIWNINNP